MQPQTHGIARSKNRKIFFRKSTRKQWARGTQGLILLTWHCFLMFLKECYVTPRLSQKSCRGPFAKYFYPWRFSNKFPIMFLVKTTFSVVASLVNRVGGMENSVNFTKVYLPFLLFVEIRISNLYQFSLISQSLPTFLPLSVSADFGSFLLLMIADKQS